MAPKLALLIELWTCENCNGEGRLTSSSTKTNEALGYFERTTEVHDCTRCNGSGIKADAAAQLGLL